MNRSSRHYQAIIRIQTAIILALAATTLVGGVTPHRHTTYVSGSLAAETATAQQATPTTSDGPPWG